MHRFDIHVFGEHLDPYAKQRQFPFCRHLFCPFQTIIQLYYFTPGTWSRQDVSPAARQTTCQQCPKYRLYCATKTSFDGPGGTECFKVSRARFKTFNLAGLYTKKYTKTAVPDLMASWKWYHRFEKNDDHGLNKKTKGKIINLFLFSVAIIVWRPPSVAILSINWEQSPFDGDTEWLQKLRW